MLTDCMVPLAGLYSSRTTGSAPLLDEATSCALQSDSAIGYTWAGPLVVICF